MAVQEERIHFITVKPWLETISRRGANQQLLCALIPAILLGAGDASASENFQGQIRARAGRTGAPAELLYTVGTNLMRVEMLDTNFPNPIDIVDLESGQITLIMPMNRTFMRFKPGIQRGPAFGPAFPVSPGALPPGIGPQAVGPGATPPGFAPPAAAFGPTNLPGVPAIPALPAPPGGLPLGIGPQSQAPAVPGVAAMPSLPAPPPSASMPAIPPIPTTPPGVALELQPTGEQTNLLGNSCATFQIKQRGESMEVWATDQLAPFQAYLPNQPPSFGPPMIEYQWSGLLSARKLFPLRAVLRADNGPERYRFEVLSITPRKLTQQELKGFQPPEGYVEIQPRPF